MLTKVGGIKRVEVGDVWGRLTVLEYAGRDKFHNKLFKCQCQCGERQPVITESHLRLQHTRSCGCLGGVPGIHGFPRGDSRAVALNIVYNNYLQQAKLRGIEFSLTRDNFGELLQKNCEYCGNPPCRRVRRARVGKIKNLRGFYENFMYNGLDRVDPSQGYKQDNVVTCCWTCNRIKSDMTKQEFVSWLKAAYARTVMTGT